MLLGGALPANVRAAELRKVTSSCAGMALTCARRAFVVLVRVAAIVAPPRRRLRACVTGTTTGAALLMLRRSLLAPLLLPVASLVRILLTVRIHTRAQVAPLASLVCTLLTVRTHTRARVAPLLTLHAHAAPRDDVQLRELVEVSGVPAVRTTSLFALPHLLLRPGHVAGEELLFPKSAVHSLLLRSDVASVRSRI